MAVSVEEYVQFKLPAAVQLSVASAPPLSFNHAVRDAGLVGPHSTVTFAATTVITGTLLSSTVMDTFCDVVFPHSSVAENTTTFSPMSEQSKSVVAKEIATVPQLSEVPLSSEAAVMLPLPAASRMMVAVVSISRTGPSVSCTVIVWV